MNTNQDLPKALTLRVRTAYRVSPSIRSIIGDMRIIEEAYAPGLAQERHAHSYTNVSLVLAGSVEETVGRAHEHGFPLSVVIKPRGTEHTNRFGMAGARTLSVQLKSELIESLTDWDLSLTHWRWLHGGPAARWMLRLLQRYRQGAVLKVELEDCVYEILASIPGDQSSFAGTRPPRWLELVKEELDATFAEGIRVRDLAARAGVHPIYLARRFRRHIGCSITDYRTRLRVRAVAELLASSTVPLAVTASQCGFTDQSHLCRAFKAASGLTPLDYRRLTNVC